MNTPRNVPTLAARVSGLLLLSLALAVAAAPLPAQSARGGFALLGGGSMHDDLTPGLGDRTVFETGWVAGMQLERWLGGGRTGLRLNGLFTQRPLEGATGDYNVYAADVDLLIRLLRVRHGRALARHGRALAPYIALGAGATHYADVGGSPVLAGGAYGDHPVRAHLWTGAGIDIAPGHGAGLRIEVADQIILPSVGRSPPASGLPMVHNLVVTTGVQLRMGQLQRPIVIAHAEPAPAPPTEAARAEAQAVTPEAAVSEPAPSEEAGPMETLYTVQVGSFLEWNTARRWRDRLADRGVPVWLLDTEVEGEPLSRLRVGALQSEAEADQLADTLERDYGWTVSVHRIAQDEPVPAGAVGATWAYLQAR